MQALRSPVALLLLLCLTRTLLPDAWLLALHAHAHTTAEPAHGTVLPGRGKAVLSAKHQHCAVEHFYQAAYQAGAPVALPARRLAARYAEGANRPPVRPAADARSLAHHLRGPPRHA